MLNGRGEEEVDAYLNVLLIFRLCCVYIHWQMYGTACVWRSKDNFEESVPFFYCVVSGDQTQTIKLKGKCLYPLSYLTGPKCGVYNVTLTGFL